MAVQERRKRREGRKALKTRDKEKEASRVWRERREMETQREKQNHLNRVPAAFQCQIANVFFFKSEYIPIAVIIVSIIVSMHKRCRGNTTVS